MTCLVAWFTLAAPLRAWAVPYDMDDLLGRHGATVAVLDAALTDQWAESPYPALPRGLRQDLASFNVFWHMVISDENWEAWRSFQRESTTIIPVTSIAFYRVHTREAAQFKPPPPIAADRLAEGVVWTKAVVYGGGDATAPEARPGSQQEVGGWNPLQWLFSSTGTGLSPGREWDWSRFWERAATAGGLVLLLLLGVEVLRAVFSLGLFWMDHEHKRKRKQ